MDLFINKIIEKHVIGKKFELYRSCTQDSNRCDMTQSEDLNEKFTSIVTSADYSPSFENTIDLHVKCVKTNKEYIIEHWSNKISSNHV